MDLKNYLFDSRDKYCQLMLNKKLNELVEGLQKKYSRIAVICIGTDCCTGDSFGPLVGYLVSRWSIYDFELYGTIHRPVHAKNLEETLSVLDLENKLVIAVDSSLGIPSHIGGINVGCSPIRPGSSLGKALPAVGDIHIAGIVNMDGPLPLAVLQSTRLGLVFSMAEIASRAIIHVLFRHMKKRGSRVGLTTALDTPQGPSPAQDP